MNEEFWNNYFKEEDRMSLKYGIESLTKPATYEEIWLGHRTYTDVQIRSFKKV